ncbi:MAG: anti-sigma factor [Winogradskyella sp.]|uniref:FecR family protein n=1 Tax=Winogradskyella sp. TaxID=1883156 RepID=UPI0017C86880|nr:anti-sigma factor [Winogradskyella sp.]
MEREELIKKWLDHNLSEEEHYAFSKLKDYETLNKMSKRLHDFKAPEFFVDEHYEKLIPKLKTDHTISKPWYKPILKIAAILVLGLSIYYYSTTLNTELKTAVAEQTTLNLPDASLVILNANSTLIYNESNWDSDREVILKGEAYFKVAKGKLFDVITKDGIVSVLGTEFNVRQRNNYFEVTCFEGSVSVAHNKDTVILKPGNTFRLIDGKLLVNEKEITTQPTWLRGESSFNAVPLKYVISEFENHYPQKIELENIDSSRLFTGSFTHKNVDLALQSIAIPLNLSYSKYQSSIVLTRE